MSTTLIELTLGELPSSEIVAKQSFNNDSVRDKIRNSFCELMPSLNFYGRMREKVPSKYLHPNVHRCSSSEIFKLGDKIAVGIYCDEGVVAPRTYSIVFNQLYNCAPLISLIKGDEEYLSFLHTWAIVNDSDVIDKQVKHWMETVSKFGDILETVFAPRKGQPGCSDTKYKNAIDDIQRVSKKTVVLARNIMKLEGIANREGVYFRECGYHLWDK